MCSVSTTTSYYFCLDMYATVFCIICICSTLLLPPFHDYYYYCFAMILYLCIIPVLGKRGEKQSMTPHESLTSESHMSGALVGSSFFKFVIFFCVW